MVSNHTKSAAAATLSNRIFTDKIFFFASLATIAVSLACGATESLPIVLVVVGTLYGIYASAAVGFANRQDKFLYAIAGAFIAVVMVLALLHVTNGKSLLIWLYAKLVMVLVGAVFGVAVSKKIRRGKIVITFGAFLIAFIVHFAQGETATESKEAGAAHKISEIYSYRDMAEDGFFTAAAAVFCEILFLTPV